MTIIQTIPVWVTVTSEELFVPDHCVATPEDKLTCIAKQELYNAADTLLLRNGDDGCAEVFPPPV